MDQAGKRRWGSGSIQVNRRLGGCDVVVSTGRLTATGRRQRKYVHFPDRAAAEAALPHLLAAYGREAPSALARPVRRLTVEQAAVAVLKRARVLRWPDATTARVLAATLAPRRLRAGVVGPCAYCGDEFASTVDHIDPSMGDRLGNLTSSCVSCNSSKGRRTPRQWGLGRGR